MPSDSGSTTSVWMETDLPSFPSLRENLHVDVCVVGGGIAGMSTAYLLAKEGRTVVVIDDGPLGGGETGRTTAHLASALDDRFFELERLHGRRGARLAAESHGAAIDMIESIVSSEEIDCEFERVDGYLFAPSGESTEVLDEELDAARRAGLYDVEMLERAPLPFFDTGRCLRFPGQAQFHPLKYLAGLARALQEKGGLIFSATHAETIEGGTPATVATLAGAVVTADAVVVATNTPVNDRFVIHTKQAAYRTYAIGMKVPKGSVHRALYWDTLDPYHYVRLTGQDYATHEILIVGGEDHRTGQESPDAEPFDRLEAWTRERFPMVTATEFRWSGQVLEPIDFLAFIGPNPSDEPNVYVATGDSGHGMTHGTIAGMLLTDLIAGRENPWVTLYDPGRKTLRAAGEFTRTGINVALQYADWVTAGQVDSVDDIPPASGAIMRRRLKKVAVYRDVDGATHAFNAECPHLGCIVQWNSTEGTWDCPCHGSRFDAYGRVINGPANADLEEIEGA